MSDPKFPVTVGAKADCDCGSDCGCKPAEGKQYWRSLGELAESLEYRQAKKHVPGGVSGPADGFSRRNFLSLMGASMGLAGLAACRRPEEKILPYARAPEKVTPGIAEHYATAFPWQGTAIGLLVESHEGRPTKIEGNPKHPESLGGTTAFAQASVLDLYDPDRSTAPTERGMERTWDEVAAFLKARGAGLKVKGGQGLLILAEAHRSPTLTAALDAVEFALPQAKILRYEPFDRDRPHEGARIALGKTFEALPDLAKAEVIVALDCDLFGWEGSPARQMNEFALRRKVEKPGDEMSRLYAVESAYSITGAAADHRLRLPRKEIPAFVFSLARELSAQGLDLGEIGGAVGGFADKYGAKKPWLKAMAKDLLAHRKNALLVAGSAQPAAVHAVLHAIHHALGAVGTTVTYAKVFEDATEGAGSLKVAADALRSGEIDTVLMLGGNPVLTAGPDTGFTEALAKAKAIVHLSSHRDETSALATWHLNRAHYLESWSDVRAADGTATILQPLIAPLFDGKTEAEVLALLLGTPRKAYDLVRENWQAQLRIAPAGALAPLGGGAAPKPDLNVPPFELAWRQALHDGLLQPGFFTIQAPPVDRAAVAKAIAALPAPAAGLEVTFHPDPHAFDGRYANNGWLQEMPDTMVKQTWGNAALVSTATAAKLGLVEGDLVELKLAAPINSVKLPVAIAPGQADESIAVSVGQGRRRAGRVGDNVGHDTYPLRVAAPIDAALGVQASKAGSVEPLARTQEHALMEGRPLVREGTLKKFEEEPKFAQEMVDVPPLLSLFDDHPYPGQRWGLVIDLNACTGCNACAVACQAENNVPLVGKSGVMRSREMHWLRIDRYFEGSPDEPKAVFQPVACQQCENAPCEQVCPVGATTHSPEGLNDMAYNRCIGTRYCANNCPFKVRRFNFFNYTKDTPDLQKLQKNPEVTVRSRGVMEKCTYCVQRIQAAKIEAHKRGEDKVAEGSIKTACQQACPAQAIRFGDLNDPDSEVRRLAGLSRDYAMLAELNVRPRTSYLARVRNPNPDLEAA
ncbi:MAG TPA: TAT-variant-translocated molybdopterin oxidoreductase [Myxococcales bacterium]